MLWLRGCIGSVVARSPLRECASRRGARQGRFAALRARTSSTLDPHPVDQGRTQLRGSALTCEQHPGDPVRPGGSGGMFGPSADSAGPGGAGSEVAPSRPTEVAKPGPVTGFPGGFGEFCRSGRGPAADRTTPRSAARRGSVGCRLVGPIPVYWTLSVEQPAIGGRRVRVDAGSLGRCRSVGRYRSSRRLSAGRFTGRFTGWSAWWCARSARWFSSGCPGRPALSNLPVGHRNLPARRRHRRATTAPRTPAEGC